MIKASTAFVIQTGCYCPCAQFVASVVVVSFSILPTFLACHSSLIPVYNYIGFMFGKGLLGIDNLAAQVSDSLGGHTKSSAQPNRKLRVLSNKSTKGFPKFTSPPEEPGVNLAENVYHPQPG